MWKGRDEGADCKGYRVIRTLHLPPGQLAAVHEGGVDGKHPPVVLSAHPNQSTSVT